MAHAAEEEIALAIANGDVGKDKIPHIMVTVDGAWAKRSYRTNYNSMSGVAAIVGYRTKKIFLQSEINTALCVNEPNAKKRNHVNIRVPRTGWALPPPWKQTLS